MVELHRLRVQRDVGGEGGRKRASGVAILHGLSGFALPPRAVSDSPTSGNMAENSSEMPTKPRSDSANGSHQRDWNAFIFGLAAKSSRVISAPTIISRWKFGLSSFLRKW